MSSFNADGAAGQAAEGAGEELERTGDEMKS